MSLVRVQSFAISLDGFGTGEGQSLQSPFGHAGHRLHTWMFGTRWGKAMMGLDGGSSGFDFTLASQFAHGVGAEIMGANKFGPPGWQDDPTWQGWWGSNPPFHTPVFVLTHRPRPAITMEGGNSFHFITATPAEALQAARAAAGDLDVRIGGGVSTLRQFLAAGLVDHMHLVVVPIILGRGERLWDGLEGIEQRYDVESVVTPSGVTHMMFSRKANPPV